MGSADEIQQNFCKKYNSNTVYVFTFGFLCLFVCAAFNRFYVLAKKTSQLTKSYIVMLVRMTLAFTVNTLALDCEKYLSLSIVQNHVDSAVADYVCNC